MVEITIPIVLQFLQTAGILVGIIYYVMTIRTNQRNQQLTLETRQAQLFQGVFNKLDGQWWDSLHMLTQAEIKDYQDFSEKFYPMHETELGIAQNRVGVVLEYIGVLVRENLLDIRFVALQISSATMLFWEKMAPIIQDWRDDAGSQRIYIEVEYLYNELVKYLEEHPELTT
jgi:hypothetical protein